MSYPLRLEGKPNKRYKTNSRNWKTCKLDPALHLKLKQFAERNNVSMNDLVNAAVSVMLMYPADILNAPLNEHVLRKYNGTKDRPHTPPENVKYCC